MNSNHPSADQLERYRHRTASPAESLEVDAHIAACDACFDAVRADVHLTYDELEALADGRSDAAPHLALCAICRGELADLRQMRDTLVGAQGAGRGARRRTRRPWLLAAAAILLLIFALLSRRTEPKEVPSEVPVVRNAPPPTPKLPDPVTLEKPRILDTLVTTAGVLRGGVGAVTFALQAPVGTVVLEERPRFLWESVRGATSYDVAVVDLDRGTVAASGSATSTAWQPDAPLPRGRTYAWQVTAHTSGGRFVAPGRKGAEARFHVDAKGNVDGNTHLDRGIALARRGALDDAQRELELARAPELLAQIRAWRSQRPLPTTTNGAQ